MQLLNSACPANYQQIKNHFTQHYISAHYTHSFGIDSYLRQITSKLECILPNPVYQRITYIWPTSHHVSGKLLAN